MLRLRPRERSPAEIKALGWVPAIIVALVVVGFVLKWIAGL